MANVPINIKSGESLWGVVARDLDCILEVSEFELQSLNYVHFPTNTLEKNMNSLILPAMG